MRFHFVDLSWQRSLVILGAVAWLAGGSLGQAQSPEQPVAASADASGMQPATAPETRLLSNIRQITFEGRRAGEGYFSREGTKMVFQSERDPQNPFFQIYLLDFATGDLQRVSPGYGKTTCGWIHPDGKQVLFASTHDDPAARQKQQQELEQRRTGAPRRYNWDYDEHYDLYRCELPAGSLTNLTGTLGYDAEASWSPDGRRIAWASNRHAYASELSEVERQRLAQDPSVFVDLYLMDADGSNVRRLTDAAGYDGGPFFSPDGNRLCWRRFAPDGATAEIMTMALDGADVRTLTRLGAMSWAPFYHPSGKYLVFATNVHGFDNFELYLVDAAGLAQPVRVTSTPGFDGLPTFTPDGKLSWTSNRGLGQQSQIFLADWDHHKALELLNLAEPGDSGPSPSLAAVAAHESSRSTHPDCTAEDVLRHVDYLCRPELKGRRTGTPGEQLATAYVAAYLDQLGLSPAGDGGSWYQAFRFTSGVNLGSGNQLAADNEAYEVKRDWMPLAFSQTGQITPAPVLFAGYGIVAPRGNDQDEYDSYVHLEVKDKWILAFRFLPENVTAERRQHLARHANLRFKAMLARDKGAHGLILVNGPNSSTRDELIRLEFDGSLSSSSLPVISISNEVAQRWLARSGKSLKALQDELDSGQPSIGFALPDLQVAAQIDIEQIERSGRNVLGRLSAGDRPTDQVVVVGAHIDHLGEGPHSSSLAGDADREGVHWGADDNASGVAAMLEIAEWLVALKAKGDTSLQRDLIFAAWSGEEDGLIGSSHFVKEFGAPAGTSGAGSAGSTRPLYPAIAACLNLDMVGRLDKRLILQGIGSSSIWRGEIERRNAIVGLPITVQDDSFIPTDASAFATRGVPILSAFTGAHADYHTPRDTPDKLNYEGAAAIARFMALVTRSVAMRAAAPDYIAQSPPPGDRPSGALRAYLGTVPDYAESDVKGVKLAGVSPNGPAAKAGVQPDDIVVELGGRAIENIYDYTFAIEALKIGEPTKLVVSRNGQRVIVDLVPTSRP